MGVSPLLSPRELGLLAGSSLCAAPLKNSSCAVAAAGKAELLCHMDVVIQAPALPRSSTE